jgi:chromosomal replication initiator protein
VENPVNNWPQLQARLSLEFSDGEFETYFKSARVRAWEGKHLILEAADPFRRDWMQARKDRIEGTLRKATASPDLVISFASGQTESLSSPGSRLVAERVVLEAPPLQEERQISLLPFFRFDSFIVGPGSRFAHAAALAVAENPAKNYNPLVLHGGAGSGKTHLLHAIGNQAIQRNPGFKVAYVTSENFMNEMISVLRNGGDMRHFRDKFRKVDMLLVDDLQFLSGKESTQEEFFHTFNDLHAYGRQIVATCDIPPNELRLEERLKNRFEWGLVAEIGLPDLDTRLAILRKKAEKQNLAVPREILEYLASHFATNVRELEGALTKVLALGSILKQELSLGLAQEALRGFLKSQAKPVGMEAIQQAVAEHYKLKSSDMKARKRTEAIAFPRQIAMFLCRELTQASFPEIGQAFGGRDHSTVIHAVRKISQKMKSDAGFQKEIGQLSHPLKERGF